MAARTAALRRTASRCGSPVRTPRRRIAFARVGQSRARAFAATWRSYCAAQPQRCRPCGTDSVCAAHRCGNSPIGVIRNRPAGSPRRRSRSCSRRRPIRIGQWILAPHAEAANEVRWTGVVERKLAHGAGGSRFSRRRCPANRPPLEIKHLVDHRLQDGARRRH